MATTKARLISLETSKADLVDGKVPNAQSQVPSTQLSVKITVGTDEPSNPSVGDLWIDTNP